LQSRAILYKSLSTTTLDRARWGWKDRAGSTYVPFLPPAPLYVGEAAESQTRRKIESGENWSGTRESKGNMSERSRCAIALDRVEIHPDPQLRNCAIAQLMDLPQRRCLACRLQSVRRLMVRQPSRCDEPYHCLLSGVKGRVASRASEIPVFASVRRFRPP